MATQAHSEEQSGTRQALLEAVVRVAGRDGFEALTYRAVAAEAGVSHGLVRYHFGTLSHAVAEALQWTVDEAIARAPLAGSGGLREFADSLSRLMTESPEHAAFQWGCVMHAQRHPALLDEVRAFQDRYVEQIESELDRLGLAATPSLARSVFAFLNGMVLRHLVYGSAEETDQDITVLHDLLSSLARADRPRIAVGSGKKPPAGRSR